MISTSSLLGTIGYCCARRSPDTVRCHITWRSQDCEAFGQVWASGGKSCLPTWPIYEVAVDLFLSGMCLVYIYMNTPGGLIPCWGHIGMYATSAGIQALSTLAVNGSALYRAAAVLQTIDQKNAPACFTVPKCWCLSMLGGIPGRMEAMDMDFKVCICRIWVQAYLTEYQGGLLLLLPCWLGTLKASLGKECPLFLLFW